MTKTVKQMTMALMAVAGMSLSATAVAPTKDIVDTAVGAGQFTILAKLVTDAGLVPTLKGKGPFTVFAPTDAAFKKLPKATLDKVGADKKLLTSILTYHVVAGNVMAKDVVKLRSAKTVNGANVQIAVRGGKVFLNGKTQVTATDIKASNGVIHVIDSVLMPPAPAKTHSHSN